MRPHVKNPPIRPDRANGRCYATLWGERVYLCQKGEWNGRDDPFPPFIRNAHRKAVKGYDPDRPPAWVLEKRAARQGGKVSAAGVTVPETVPGARAATAQIIGSAPLIVAEVIDLYLPHVRRTYVHVADGTPTSQQHKITSALRVLNHVAGTVEVTAFGVLELERVRDEMIARGFNRATCNTYTNLITRMFTWATARKMCPPTLPHELAALEGLRLVRSGAEDEGDVRQVPVLSVLRTLPFLPAPLRDACRFMGLTACRPGEALALRGRAVRPDAMLSASHPEFAQAFRPAKHKTQHVGKVRSVPLTADALAVFGPLLADPEQHAFRPVQGRSPRYTVSMLNSLIRSACEKGLNCPAELRGRWKLSKGCKDLAIGRGRRKPFTPDERERYQAWAYAHAWSANQLRHTRLTQLRALRGLDYAQLVAGHSSNVVTQVYAELTPEWPDLADVLGTTYDAEADPVEVVERWREARNRKAVAA